LNQWQSEETMVAQFPEPANRAPASDKVEIKSSRWLAERSSCFVFLVLVEKKTNFWQPHFL